MSCLNERMVGAVLLMLGGSAFAGGPAADLPEAMTVANIAPLPVEVVAPAPEPQAWLFHYEMETQASQAKPFFAQMDQFYSAQLGHTYTFVKKPAPGSGTSANADTSPSAQFLDTGPSTAPQISIVQLPTSNTALGAAPQRRLSLTVDDWVFSGTARVAVLHSHDSGATLTVRHGF
ncbi:hypothetical protein B0G62_11725 [Paraburkholderia eburnea]|uniref:Uncharacterized protein n=2 Tax=Paraburkholderia eburnea TaxID=1189126 RepID=A0A2S4LYW4_9BURK|nr:hypothetical protein [Paraburkholderia eburnea]POR47651.1 hypothetical protein B0G62_11725 [Paraburkholderia eburnea]PRZ19153.1 hypothetical protein BX588_11725 [Paraburkholderia eburnea]